MAAPMEVNISSFRKKIGRKSSQIPGTKPSIINNQLLISTGIPSLDNFLGGGVAVGSVLLIEEDAGGCYGRLMLQLFLAEGVVCKHALLCASGDTSPQKFLQDLPGPIIHDKGLADIAHKAPFSYDRPKNERSNQNDDLTIAWRYKNLSLESSTSHPQFGHYYDLSKKIDQGLLNAVDKTYFEPAEVESEQNSPLLNATYSKLLESINKQISDGKFSTSSQLPEHNILRIGIHCLGSPQWEEQSLNSKPQGYSDPSLFRFLYALRSVVRSSYTVAAITLPVHLFKDSAFLSRLECLGDSVIRLESFCGTNMQQDFHFRNYNGLCHIVKLPRLNCLTSHDVDTHDLAFKVRRKRFTIEKLHLPPAISDTSSTLAETDERSKHLFDGQVRITKGMGNENVTSDCNRASYQEQLDF